VNIKKLNPIIKENNFIQIKHNYNIDLIKNSNNNKNSSCLNPNINHQIQLNLSLESPRDELEPRMN